MQDILSFLREEGVRPELLEGVENFLAAADAAEAGNAGEAGNDGAAEEYRIPDPQFLYYGKEVWAYALAALLTGRNLLLAGPKATGKNVLAEDLAALFKRPLWNISFHVSTDAASLIGTDTYDGNRVSFRPGPVTQCARKGGFAVLDEINMAKNEALSVLHSVLDFRRIIDLPGYERIALAPETRFIATMNYGYAGTRDLNDALASRFVIINMPVITEEDLNRLIIRSYPGIREQIAGQFAKLFTELERKAESAEITERAVDLRGLLDALGLIRQGLTSGEALSLCVTNKTFDRYERNLVQDVIDARIPGDLDAKTVFG